MDGLDRRDLLKGALWGAAAAAVFPKSGMSEEKDSREDSEEPVRPWKVVDTNISLFQWPFRRLPYDQVDELVEKLRALEIDEAWAGSYEGILHRDLTGVNLRLAEACRDEGKGLLVPIGSVNLELPDWEEDLRGCQEEFGMPGIRLHPNYHGYTLDDPRFERLLAMAAERGLLVQLAASMEDRRTQHPMLQVADVDLGPLPDLMQKVPGARVLVLNSEPRGELLKRLAAAPGISFDMARVRGTDGVANLVRSVPREQVVFGTHAPFFLYEAALIKVYESELSDEECLALFEKNARRLVAYRSAG